MKSLTVEEAESNFSSVLSIVRSGQEVAVTSRRKTVAKIVPAVSATNGGRGTAAVKQRQAAWAEHFKKLGAIYGGKSAPGKPASRIIIEGRR